MMAGDQSTMGAAAGPEDPAQRRAGTVGVVVIGRNEGERLRRCLESILRSGAPVVYADSGSTDGSVEAARALGAAVVQLDRSVPFTAARGRNEGFDRLMIESGPPFVQFVDGDCELAAGWLGRAAAVLESDPGLALVCGRLREKHRDTSIYARLCDMEWQGPVGPITACGGIFMTRAAAFKGIGGFDRGRAAGEEPHLCTRLTRAGWRLERIDAEMGTHDAAMTRFGQWWRRAVRSGWGTANAASDVGRSAGAVRRVWSTLAWAFAPALFAAAVTAVEPWPRGLLAWAAALGAYALLFVRVYQHRRRAGNTGPDARLYALFCVLSKWPESVGIVTRWLGR